MPVVLGPQPQQHLAHAGLAPAIPLSPQLHAAGSAPSRVGYTIEYACLETLQYLLGRAAGDVDLAAADAFATGVTLFQLATGGLPLPADSEQRSGKAAMARRERRLLEQVGAGACSQGRSPGARCCVILPWFLMLRSLLPKGREYHMQIIMPVLSWQPCWK